MKTFATLALWTLLAGPVWAQDPFAVDPFLAAAPAKPTYAQAYAVHQRDHVPLIVLVTTDHCAACEVQKSLFAAADFHGAVVCEVHSSASRICAELKVDQFPTVVVLHPQGWARRYVGLTATEKIMLGFKEEAKPRPFPSTRATLARSADGSGSKLLATTPMARTRTFARPVGQAGCIVNG